MIVAHPMPLAEAVAVARTRGILPTSATSAQIAKWDAAVKRQSVFSATVQAVRVLQGLDAGVAAVLNGDASQREVREQLLDLHAALGTPAGPGKPGTVQDVTSVRRADLQVRTLVDTAHGLGWQVQGMEPEVLDAYPAQELIRFITPKVKARDWPARWAKAGGRFIGRRMVALKTDEVWTRLGDPAIFPDALGNPYPPFAYGSGMDVQDVDRAEAERLGLIDRKTVLKPAPVDLSGQRLQGPVVAEQWLQRAIEQAGLGRIDGEGILRALPGEASS